MQAPQNNFIIQFTGREGSSAIISALSAQTGVNVPLFEELDFYTYRKHHKAADYPQSLDEVFSTGKYTGERTHNSYLHVKKPDQNCQTIGFKWRTEGKIPDVANVLKKHNVTVFLLQRRDFLSMTCSSYVHGFGNKIQSEMDVPPHPHFIDSFGDKNSSAALKLEKLSQQEFRMVKRLFLTAAKNVAFVRKRQIGRARQLARAGIPLRMMYYEDFDADPKAFLIETLAKVGLDISNTYNPYCGFDKVHKRPLSERIQGLEKVCSGWSYRYFKREYDAAIELISGFETT